MALIKEKLTAFNIPASYWRICYLSLDKINMYGSISLNLFFDKNAAQYLDSYTEVIDTPEKFIEFFSAISLQNSYKDIYNAAYEFVKKYSSFFSDAKNDDDEFEIDLISPTGPTGSTEENNPTGPTGSTEENNPTGPTGSTEETL